MNRSILAIGDAVAILFITLLGFITHGEANIFSLPRFLALFAPTAITWLLLASLFKLFQTEIVRNPKQLWRIPLAMCFTTPFAIAVRSVLLAAEIKPIFVFVFGVISALGLTFWRGLYILLKPKAREER